MYLVAQFDGLPIRQIIVRSKSLKFYSDCFALLQVALGTGGFLGALGFFFWDPVVCFCVFYVLCFVVALVGALLCSFLRLGLLGPLAPLGLPGVPGAAPQGPHRYVLLLLHIAS